MAEGFFTSATESGPHKVFYQSWGDPAGRPLVCVHGLTGSSQDFKYVGEYLAPLGYYTVALDLPGRGRSDFLQNPANYRFEQYYREIDLFLQHLNLSKVDWLGVSMGGLLGIRIAGRAASPIERIILSDVGPEVPSEALAAIVGYLMLAPVFTSVDEFAGGLKQLKGTPFYRGDMSEEHWHYYASTHVRKNALGFYVRAFDPAIVNNFISQPLGAEDLWDFWDKISQPVLTLRGELSALLTEDIIARMEKRKTGASMQTHRFPGIGHVPSLYPPEQIKVLADWLMQTKRPAAA